jgi:hypothetical protein
MGQAIGDVKEGARRKFKELTDIDKDKIYAKYSEIQRDLFTQVKQARYGIMTVLGIFFAGFLLFTSPIWLTILFLNLPLILGVFFLSMYTKVIIDCLDS